MSEACVHVPAQVAAPRAAACEGCGSTFNLRLCAACGYVGCCESQRAHDRSHALGAEHPVIKSLRSRKARSPGATRADDTSSSTMRRAAGVSAEHATHASIL